MPIRCSAIALVAIAAALPAQRSNELSIYSESTNLTTRSGLPGTSTGEVCVRFPAALFAGVGQTDDPVSGRAVNRITGLRYTLADQNASTPETYQIGIKGSDPLAPTQVDPTHDLLRSASLNLPPSTSTSAVAWVFTSSFATPFDAAPAQADLWLFVDLPTAPAWTADGLSVHACYWAGPLAWTPGDTPNPRAVLLPLVHVIDQTAIAAGTSPQSAVLASTDHIARISLLTPGVTLEVGSDVDPNLQRCPNPNYGVGGLYPDHGPTRRDGLAFRIVDVNSDGSPLAVVGAFGGPRRTAPTPLSSLSPGGVGAVFLPTPFIVATFAAGTTGTSGFLQQVTFPWPLVVAAPVGPMSFQAFVLDRHTGRLRASNLAGFDAQ